MAVKPDKKGSTGSIVKMICRNCGLEKVVREYKSGEIHFCDSCQGSMSPAEGQNPKAAKEPAKLVCTNCGKEAEARDYKPGDIVFCPQCQGSMTPVGKTPAKGVERSFGKYRILREIGKGGMGVVYLASHTNLKREVALKVLNKSGGANPAMIDWLVREAQAASKLRHPNIVTVHDVDSFEGEHYIAMDFIDGQGMDVVVSPKKPFKPQKAAKILHDVADAINYAHERGIIHRDIKPSNILVDKEGKPFVMDFGIARDVRAAGSGVESGSVLGTPGYMSPEQADGEDEIDRRSDVFSLGALLYFALTGAPPFTGANAAEIMKRTRDSKPVTAEDLGKAVPPELGAICLKALSKDKEGRYKSARLMADDLGRFLRGESVFAADRGLWTALLKTVIRHKIAVGIGAAVSILFAVVIAAALSSKPADETRIEEERKKAEKLRKEQEDRAKRERDDMEREHLAKEFQNLKKLVLERIDSTKKMVRTRFEALEKTYFQNPEASLKALEEVENDLRSVGAIVAKEAADSPEVLKRLKEDGDVADALYVKQDFPRVETLRAKIYSVLGWMAWQTGLDAEKAVSYYNLALQLSPKDTSFNKGRGMVEFESGQWKPADHDLSIAIGGDPQTAKDPYMIAYAVESKARCGFFEQIDGLLEGIPADSADRLFLEGLTVFFRNDFKAAIEKFKAATARNITHPRAHVMEGMSYFVLKDYAKALDKFEQIIGLSRLFKIQKDPNLSPRDNMITYTPLAETYMHRGLSRLKIAEESADVGGIADAKKACAQDLRKALDLVPGLKEAKEWLDRMSGK